MSVNKKKRRECKIERGQSGSVLEVMWGGIFGFAVVLIILCALGLLVYRGKCGWQAAEYAVCLSPLLGGLTAGLMSRRKNKKRNVPRGLAGGAIVFLMLLSLAMIMPHTDVSMGQGSIAAGLCLCGGGLGGIIKKRKTKR